MRKFFSGLSKDTFFLTFTSLFADISTEMLYPVLPIFITQTLLAPTIVVGLVEGMATATQNIIQGFSGTLADKFKKRKPIALIGYSIAALSKPLTGLSVIWPEVLGARFLDRLGTGIRSAPRDGLIAGSVSEENRGKAFGLEGIGDNLGAFIGPIIAILLLYFLHLQIRTLFYLAIIPGLLAVSTIAFVKDKNSTKINLAKKNNVALSVMSKPFLKYLFVSAVFGIGNSSNAFLILRVKNLGISLEITILIYAFFNLIAAISSYPAGFLSDIFGRKNLLFSSFVIFILTYLGFAFSHNLLLVAFLFMLYGVFGGTYRAVGKAFATDFAPSSQRASAVGWYSTTIGLTGFVASLVGGFLWTAFSPQATFIYGASLAILGSILLLFFIPIKKIN